MIHNDWELLLSRSVRPSPSVLSVYLNVDQSRQANLNRGFEKRFRDLMASLGNTIHDSTELQRFHNAQHHLSDFLTAYGAGGRTLVMFFDESDGFFWQQQLEIPIPDLVRWDRHFLLKPLAAATDDFERYGIVLADRANARLFTVFLGEMEEVAREAFDPMKVRHIRAIGTDRWSSASQMQKRADEQVRRNLRQVVRDLDFLVQSKHVDRLVLAGAPEVTSELRNLLPKRLALRVIGDADIDANAPPRDVLKATLRLTESYERDSERQLVNEVATSAAKTKQAVVGLSNTLKRINEARVWQLLYSEDFHAPGFECLKCNALFSIEPPSCSYCGTSTIRVNDVVERAVECALRSQARIEIVRGEAAASLDNAGGIAAFLKARTKTLEV
jgi:peptide subunit release factor 1 (eRF1)